MPKYSDKGLSYGRGPSVPFVALGQTPRRLMSDAPRRAQRMVDLEKLKSFDADRVDMDEMITLSAAARIVVAEYESNKVPVPEWLVDGRTSLTRAIDSRRKDSVAKSLKEKKARREALRSSEEKKADLDKDIAALEAELG